VLVNNAGTGVLGRIAEITTAPMARGDGDPIFDSVFFACRAAIPHLKATRGNIVQHRVDLRRGCRSWG